MYQELETTEEHHHVHPERQQMRRENKRRGGGYHRRGAGNIINPNDSVLWSEWAEPDRPYSQKELSALEEKLFNQLQIANMFVMHQDCGHCYRVKKNGIRFKNMLEYFENNPETTELPDVGNCSMCWKINKTPNKLRYAMNDFIKLHDDSMRDERKSFFSYQVKNIFYTWLYDEMYDY